jgi:hypothetical protein
LSALEALLLPTHKLWLNSQTNSGGFYYEDESVGLGPAIIIVAETKEEAEKVFEYQVIGGYYYRSSLSDLPWCKCCGLRWWDSVYDAPISDLEWLEEKLNSRKFLIGGTFTTVDPFVWFSDGRRFKLQR